MIFWIWTCERLCMLMSYGLKFGIVQQTLLIVNDIELKKIHIHIYGTVSASRNRCQEGISVGVEIYKHNWRKYLQTIIFSKSYFLFCRGI